MRWSAARSLSVVALVGAVLGGCDSATGNKEPKIAITVASAATLGQGLDTSVPITIARTNFSNTITLTVEGAPAGVTALLSPAFVPGGVSASILLLSATPSATPGTATLTVRATGDGVTEQTSTINLTVTVTGNFSISMLNPSVTVAQGGGGIATVLVPRTGGNGSSVSLAASGLPPGVTATFTPTPTTTTSATLALAATSGVAPGTYSVTITGSSTGLSDQATTLSVVVIAPPSTANVSIPFCADDMPVWFAFQNEGFGWQQVTPTGTAFTFAATQKLAVAYTFSENPDMQINIFHVARAEFAASNDRDCSGPKSFTGSVSGLTIGQSYRVVMGATSASESSFSPSYSLANVAARPLDLVATRGAASGPDGEFLSPDRMIVRRSLNLSTGAAIPVLDFSTAESFAPAGTSLTITGLQAADVVELHNTFWTATSTFGTAHAAQLTGGSATLYSTPAAQLVTGDVHELSIDASQSTSTLIIGRQHVEYFAAMGDLTVPMGPNLNTPTITTVTTSPYARVRGLLAAQAEYNTSAEFGYLQDLPGGGTRIVIVGATAAYLGAAPATWEVTIPDLTGTSGFNANWMLAPNQSTVYFAEAFSGRTDLLFGALPAQGDLVRLAFRTALTNTSQLYRIRDMQRARRPLRQYLRR